MTTSTHEPVHREGSTRPHRVVATLTAYNEGKTLDALVSKLRELGYDVIVVDDGSGDETSRIARQAGAYVYRHHTNLGQGCAVLTSFKAALLGDYDVVVEMDADGQHDPDEIPLMVAKLDETKADIVVGSRILGANYDGAPFFRRKLLPAFTTLINLLTGYRMTDALCGFRAFRAESLARVAPILDSMLEPEYIAAEMFIRFSGAGLSVEEIPIRLRARKIGSSRKGFIRYGMGIIKAIARVIADRKLVARPRRLK